MLNTMEFITELFCRVDGGYSEIRCLHVSGDKKLTRKLWRDMPLGEVNPRGVENLLRMNQAGYHIYIRVAVSKGKNSQKQDLLCVPALWVDIDIPGEDGYRKAISFEAPPNIVVSSGGGFHSYWLLDKPVLITRDSTPIIEQAIEGLLISGGGDRHVKDVTRILRLPGTTNVKPERNNVLCEVIDYVPGRYRFEDLHDLYASVATPLRPRATRYIPKEATSGLPKYVQYYLDHGAPQGIRNRRLFLCARAYNDVGLSIGQAQSELTGRALADGLAEPEITNTIDSAFRYASNPQLPGHMQNFIAVEDTMMDRGGVT